VGWGSGDVRATILVWDVSVEDPIGDDTCDSGGAAIRVGCDVDSGCEGTLRGGVG
jgi:hypothetical protein